MSAAGGLPRAVERAVAAGCRTIQVFTKNAGQWKGRPLPRQETLDFRRAARAAGLAPLSAHAAYLINLASPDPALWARSIDALSDELARCHQAGIEFLVIHPGSHCGEGEEAGLDRVARGIDAAFQRAAKTRTRLLLESTAGQGACLGHQLGHLAEMIRRSDAKRRLAICLDTCHLHAAGYDLVSRDGWRRLVDEVEETVGLGRVALIHANDSKRQRGSRVDRHERIGLGQLGEAAFRNLMTEPAFAGVPKILETPKDAAGEWDREGLAVLRRLAG